MSKISVELYHEHTRTYLYMIKENIFERIPISAKKEFHHPIPGEFRGIPGILTILDNESGGGRLYAARDSIAKTSALASLWRRKRGTAHVRILLDAVTSVKSP